MKRKWGQHFLVRERYVQRMIELAGVQAGDQVLEIGPGRGVLTKALLEIGAFVKAVEIDPTLQGFLQQEFCLLYTSPSPRDQRGSRMPSSA